MMARIRRIAFISVLIASLTLCAQVTQNPEVSRSAGQADSNFIHGTIVVVVETKDGFVLAGDSRGSDADGHPLPNEYRKVFSLGNRIGCVVAGLIGASSSGFELQDATAMHMDLLAQVSTRSPGLDATAAARMFITATMNQAGLLEPGQVDTVNDLAQLSAVYVSHDGGRQWITTHLKAVVTNDWSGRPEVTAHPTFDDPPASHGSTITS